MNIHASNLDIEKFRKVYALVTGGATDGERVAAQARARKIAERAGMSLNEAVSQLDSQPKPKPANFFEGFADWMEEKEPGYKAKRAREVVEREQRYASRRAEILKQFGTAKAFLDPTPNERLILKAAEPFIAELGEPYEDACGTWRRPISSFAGVHSHFFNLDDVDPEAIMAIKAAIPFPETICGAFEELKVWDKLNDDRAHFYGHHEYYYELPVELRIELLREVMRTQPVTSWGDLEARFHYKSYAWQRQWIDPKDFDDPEWSRLFDDVRILRALAEKPFREPVQNGRRTNAEKRSAVLSMLDTNPELSDREICRRVGVSPKTVGNWRRRRNDRLSQP